MKHFFFVDRIESGLAVLTLDGGGASFELPSSLLPAGIIEGRWLSLTLEPEPTKDKEVIERVRELRAQAAKDDSGGDLKL